VPDRKGTLYFGTRFWCSRKPGVCNDQGWKEQARQTCAVPPLVPGHEQHQPKSQTVHSGHHCRCAEHRGEEVPVHPPPDRTETGGRTGDHDQKNSEDANQSTADQGGCFPGGFPFGRSPLRGSLAICHNEYHSTISERFRVPASAGTSCLRLYRCPTALTMLRGSRWPVAPGQEPAPAGFTPRSLRIPP